MGLQYISFPMQDFGAGIDQLSAENKVTEGRSELLLNADPTAEGYLRKRPGYQGYAGNLPVRISRIEYTTASTGNICFLFDSSVDISSIDFSTVRSTPIIVQGRTSAAHSGDFTNTDSIHYYDGFIVQNKKEFNTGTNTLSLLGSDLGISSLAWVGVSASTTNLNNSNEVFFPDSVTLNQATADTDILYTNNTSNAIKGFVVAVDKTPTAGSSYATAPTACPVGLTTINISAGTHNLSNFNIIGKVFLDDGISYQEVLPDSLTIDSAGLVSVQIQNNTASSFNVVVLLVAVDILNSVTGTIAGNTSSSISIPNLQGDYLFASVYLQPSPGAPIEQVLPDSIAVDSATRTGTVGFTNSSSLGANFIIYYETAPISSNKLCVTGAVIGAGYTEDNPQLTLWGLDHEEIYGPNPTSSRPGWVNHIDSYRSAADNRLIAGLGGNLFQAAGDATSYLFPTLYPSIRNRVASNVNIGPAFVDTTDSSNRTRGYLSMDNISEGWSSADSIEWQSGNLVKYTLLVQGLVINGTLSTIIQNTDYLTVQQSGYSQNTGVFRIVSASNPSTDVIELIVENPLRDSNDWDEQDAGSPVGIFTDQLPLFDLSTFLPSDTLQSNLWGDEQFYSVLSSDSSTAVISGVSELMSIPAGLVLAAIRVSNVIPLQDIDGNPSSIDLVRGDTIQYDSLARQLRIKAVNSLADINCTISTDGPLEGTATVVLGTGDTNNLAVGQYINLIRAGDFTGTLVVTNILTDTTFQISSLVDATGISGVLQGYTIQIDEIMEVQDAIDGSISVSVPRRWIPIEAPEDTQDLTDNAHYRYFNGQSYSEQSLLRSTMSADNMYFTNYEDDVLKFDGSNIYRAGLFRWQPQLFFTIDSTPPAPETGKIDIPDISVDTKGADWTNNKFLVDSGEESTFLIGSKIRYSVSSPTFTVVRTSSDSSNGYIFVDRNIGGTPANSTLRQVSTYRYYLRLNAIDANQNIVASAITGAEDNLLELVVDSQVRIRVVGMPAWDVYDFDRLEVEIYRVKADTVAPFYKIATVPMSFNNGEGYLEYRDSTADDTMLISDFDPTSTLTGQELGTGFSEPIRAKYITSLGNSLILGNVKEYPKLDIQYIDTGVRITSAVLSDKKYLFRKDNTDAGTVTDMSNRATYQYKTSGEVTLTPATDIANNAGVSFTVTSTAHGLIAGDWVYLFKSSVADGNRLQYSGWWQIQSVTANDFTILHSHSSTYVPAAEDVDTYITATAPKDIPVWLGDDGNYSQLNANPDTVGSYQFAAVKRLANAINASMRMVDVSITGYTQFKPWMIGNAGSEYKFGELVISQPKVFTTRLELVLPSFTGYELFVNDVRRDGGDSISSSSTVFPSRILISYENYPELFDSPSAILDSSSASAVDVNPSDGQEITGIIPFFGESAFGAAQRDSVLVVFKTNSIYLVNLAAKRSGAPNVVQKIDSRGLGCTAPLSIANTKNGIMFANESGIYRLGQSMEIVFIGRWLDRIWKQKVNRDQLSLATGHYYANGNQYKLSTQYTDDSENDKVLLYDTTREYQADGYRDGGWTIYDNHPAIGWANLQTEAFFASTKGRVFTVRNTGLKQDFRDDNQAINMEATLRALDFGESAIRKSVISAILQFRVLQTTSGTAVYSATNLDDNFQLLDGFRLIEPIEEQDSLSDTPEVKVDTLRFSIDDRKCVYMQLKLQNNTIDEGVELCGVNFRVAGLGRQGIGSAAGTK